MDILSFLHSHGYAILFVVAIFEGPIASIVAAFLASQGYFSLGAVLLVVIAGDVVGDFAWYVLGRWSSGSMRKVAAWLGANDERVSVAANKFQDHPWVALSASKLVFGPGVAGLFVAGALKMPYDTYFTICLTVSAAQYVVFVTIGYFVGSAYQMIDNGLHFFALVATAAASIALLWFVRKSAK